MAAECECLGGEKMEFTRFIEAVDLQRMEQDAIYHNIAVRCGLSDMAHRILYVVSDEDKSYTQQELCGLCSCAKQTVNSAISGLVKNGFIELEVIPGTRNQKKILLTAKGRELAKNTTDLLREAEQRAYSRFSEDELKFYIELTERITAAVREETASLPPFDPAQLD
ncbi:MAG: winged helix-turn-helix transcriptional regulator [Clostridia bacterium]|nr:winged helix-turn-helix transcriptional regulator [Clostridia bacterium]